MNLYEISREVLNAMESLEVDENGEILSTARLDELKEPFEEKCDNIACFIKGIKAEADALKAEEDKLSGRRRVLERKADRLKRYLADAMQTVGTVKVVTARAEISFRKSNTVELDDEFIGWAAVRRKDLLSFKDPLPNKTEIKKAIGAGEDIKHAAIIERKNLQIK